MPRKAPATGRRAAQHLEASVAEQFDIFAESSAWPDPARFPHNADPHSVGETLAGDLDDTHDPLIIAGFASLDRLIGWLARCQAMHARHPNHFGSIRLLLGHEPYATTREAFPSRPQPLSEAVRHYWLEQGISLHLSAKVIAAIELLKDPVLEVRISGARAVHAKIYATDDAITVGSSNFSDAGLARQIEANVRFTIDEPERLREARQLAEAVWQSGDDYREGLRALLQELLRSVTWQEALARACAELLEGTWAAANGLGPPALYSGPPLWPSQEQGIAHALWILEHQGSVLVADATGSGKTLMGAHLVRRVTNRLARTGRGHRDDLRVLIAPPAVLDAWHRATTSCGQSIERHSYGHLSHARSRQNDVVREAVRRAQVLVVDEGHNFLRQSKRTAAIFANIADHVVLFTATPINRGPRDLLAMINLLGGDNLDDETLKVMNALWSRRGDLTETMSAGERDQLRHAIRQFTVRRTKGDLNRMVGLDPEHYRDRAGRPCRYPAHRPITYDCAEPPADLELAERIRELARTLRGLTRLQSPLELSDAQRQEGLGDASYLAGRLKGASALAAHQVMASLRSSRARLLEHLRGSSTRDDAGVAASDTRSVIEHLRRIAGRPPSIRIDADVPRWLTDAGEHAAACDIEIAVYEEIERAALAMSETREEYKAALLAELVSSGRHRLVLAFDSYLITLDDLRGRVVRHLGALSKAEVLVVTGETTSTRRRLTDLFAQDSDAAGVIALCSDAMSEGVNLQGASAVVLLDRPTVIRVAEQRIGRIDRMDSPHERIDVYWPVDPPALALRASERFIARHKLVAEYLGSNLFVPDVSTSRGARAAARRGDDDDKVLRYEDDIVELQQVAEGHSAEDDLQDAFAPVRALLEGERALVPPAVYAGLRESTVRVISSVSVVESPTPFAFMAVAGTEWGAPRWVYLAHPSAPPVTDLAAICVALRRHLGDDTQNQPFDERAASVLGALLGQLERHEESLLPRGKQRALEQMRAVLKRYRQLASDDPERVGLLDRILTLVHPSPDSASGGTLDSGRESADLRGLAEWWFHAIQEVRFRYLASRRRTRPVLLKDLRADLVKTPLSTETLRSIFDEPLTVKPLAARVVAAIVGVAQ